MHALTSLDMMLEGRIGHVVLQPLPPGSNGSSAFRVEPLEEDVLVTSQRPLSHLDVITTHMGKGPEVSHTLFSHQPLALVLAVLDHVLLNQEVAQRSIESIDTYFVREEDAVVSNAGMREQDGMWIKLTVCRTRAPAEFSSRPRAFLMVA